MKKFLPAIALCLICAFMFTACDSGKKEATQCLKEHLKCPETLKVDSIKASEQEETVIYDTMYHVIGIIGDKYQCIDAYSSIDSIIIDSVKVFKMVFPAYRQYVFSYNAQNGFGAMVHSTITIVSVDDSYMTFDEYFETYYGNKILDTCYSRHMTIPTINSCVLVRTGKWTRL